MKNKIETHESFVEAMNKNAAVCCKIAKKNFHMSANTKTYERRSFQFKAEQS